MSNLKPTFFTSDWHIGHDKALEYDSRPFIDMSDMIEGLIKRYNSTVPENGVCYFLGDMGNKPAEIKPVMDRLNGTKILILGNHDRNINSMYNAGFDIVIHGVVLYHKNERITLSHCPLLDTYREDTSVMTAYKDKGLDTYPMWHGNDRLIHRKLSFKNDGQYHLHGHIHSQKDRTQSKKILDKQCDVGVCANNYTPVSWNQIVSWIDRYEKV